MRPFTTAVFECEGRVIVGSRWTLEQVHQAYEKADDLLDYILEYKALKPVEKLGIHKVNSGFADGFALRVQKDLPDEAVQSLGLHILWNLLEKGRGIIRSAAWIYKNTPEVFKNRYASSKQAFLKDKFFFRLVPEYSFSPFRTGDNPVISQNERLSQICADLYRDSDPKMYLDDRVSPNYILWLTSPAGDKFARETTWLQGAAYHLRQSRLHTNLTASIIQSQDQNMLS